MSHLLVKELKRSKYRLLGLVGQGQFGRVYCASHRKTGRLFALKELDKQRFPTHKFLRELRFLLSLQHPNIVTCDALEHTPTGRYLVMDYCEGGTLRSLMEDDIQLHPRQCLRLVTDILAGLDHAHNRGIVHCDIKPENILLTLQADGWTARVSDFGIARLNQELSKGDLGNTGSPAYMAPERFYGQYSASSDLYAVGILLFELLTGYRPFSGVPADLMSAHLNSPVKIPETIPTPLQAVILTALQKLPARRFHSAADMLKAVQLAAPALACEANGAEDTWLLRSSIHLAIQPCNTSDQEPLQAATKQLVIPPIEVAHAQTGVDDAVGPQSATIATSAAVKAERVYHVFKSYVSCRTYTHGLLVQDQHDALGAALDLGQERAQLMTVRLPEVVQSLLVRPQGCFAITQRSIYRIAHALFQPGIAQHGQKRLQQAWDNSSLTQHVVPELIAEFGRDFLATIEANGRWMAVAVLEPDKVKQTLTVWNLARTQPLRLANQAQMSPQITAPLFHLMMPDMRHVVTLAHSVDRDTNAYITGVQLDVFTRRGRHVGSLHLPVPLRYVLTSANPYRLIALEPGHSHSVLLIDLKPLKMRRVGVAIAPALMAAPSWGYVLVADDGQIMLLDHHGQILCHLQGPTHPTAVTLLEPYGLLIATWDDGQGALHTIDLRQLDLDLFF